MRKLPRLLEFGWPSSWPRAKNERRPRHINALTARQEQLSAERYIERYNYMEKLRDISLSGHAIDTPKPPPAPPGPTKQPPVLYAMFIFERYLYSLCNIQIYFQEKIEFLSLFTRELIPGRSRIVRLLQLSSTKHAQTVHH